MSEAFQTELPTGWIIASLGDLLLPTSTVDPKKAVSSHFLYIDIDALDNRIQQITKPKLLPCLSAPSRARNEVLVGDVIFSLVRPYLRNVAAVSANLDRAVASTAFVVCRPAPGIDPRYLLAGLSRESFIASIVTYGNSPPAARDDEFLRMPIPVPPAFEQTRIADRLDELFSDLDAGVAALERAQAKLKLYRASVLKAAVEGTVTADWRAQHSHATPATELLHSILIERRRRWEEDQLARFKARNQVPPKNWKSKYQEPAAPVTLNLPPLPPEWCWVSLDALIIEGPQNGLYLPSTLYGRGVPIVRIDDFQNGWIRQVENLNRVEAGAEAGITYGLRQNDLVINRVNSMTHLGKCFVVGDRHVGVLFESNMMRSTLATGVAAKFVEFYLQSESGRRQLTKESKWAVNQASINQQDVKRTPIPLPPEAEQEAIVETVEDQFSVIDHLEADIAAKLKAARSLRQSILRHAFTGKLVPQDPNDEPASELLKRIAAERAARAHKPTAAKRPARPAPSDRTAKRGRPRKVLEPA